MAQQPSSGLGGLRARLNPNAKSFSFNPSAPSFTPQSGEQQQEVDTITKQTQDLAISDNTSTSTSTPVTTTTTTTTTTVPTTSHLDLRGDEDELEDEEPTTTTSDNKGKEVAATTTTTTTTTAPSSKKQTIQVKQPDKEHLNIVFIGHVDAGKSTISGQILYLTGRVDARTIEKYEQEAKTKNRESWFLAFILDSNEEEREKGITIEVGRGYFETSKKRYTILDAPGHKDFVPNMISGASQADVAILVISARKGEFETGFERGGQTREHVTLAKTLGVKQLIVLVNKMDESTVQWAKERWDEIIDKFVPFLKEQGINPKSVIFIPCSGFTGANIKDTVPQSVCPWFKGKSFMDTLDDLPTFSRAKAEAPLRIPVTARYKEMGVVNILGKVEQGTVKKGDSLLMMPNKTPVEVLEIIDDQAEVQYALPGENVRIKIKGIEEEAIQPGFVLSDAKNPVPCVTDFLAQFLALDLKSIFSSGFSPNLHIHTTSEECTIANLVAYVDKKTGEKLPQKPKFVKTGDLVLALITVPQPICVEKFEDLQSMGRFTLRDGGKTIAIGKVMGIKKQGK